MRTLTYCMALLGAALVAIALPGCSTTHVRRDYSVPVRVTCFDQTVSRGVALVISPRHVVTARHVIEACPNKGEPFDIRAASVEVVPEKYGKGDVVRLVAVGVGEPWRSWARSWHDAVAGDSGTPLVDAQGRVWGLVLQRVGERLLIISVEGLRELLVGVPRVSLEQAGWPLRYGPSGELRGNLP